MNKFSYNETFVLENGAVLDGIEIAYTIHGNLNDPARKVIWVCHALTANSDVFEWWPGLFGKADLFNDREFTIVCANVIGGCYGSTGPLSNNPETGKPFFHAFPLLTVKDIAHAHELLRTHLGIEKVFLGIGGSLGGQQLLEWNIENPDLFSNLVLIATNARHSPWGIAFNEAQRLAIKADSTWKNDSAEAGLNGLKAARSIALLSYRHYDAYSATQNESSDNETDNFRASAYQEYQGEKLAKRFDAFTYFTLSKAMDSHNVGRNRTGIRPALRSITAHTKVIGISSDLLFPISEQELLAAEIPNATLHVMESNFGHDGFLVETKKLTEILLEFSEKKHLKTTSITTQQ